MEIIEQWEDVEEGCIRLKLQTEDGYIGKVDSFRVKYDDMVTDIYTTICMEKKVTDSTFIAKVTNTEIRPPKVTKGRK